MNKYTQSNKVLIFNNCRQKAFLSFKKTLDSLYGKENITEKIFQKEWLENLEQEENVIADGWYNPPPYGMAVLFGDRVSFDSLRNFNRRCIITTNFSTLLDTKKQ